MNPARICWLALIVVAAFGAHVPVLGNGFLNWDETEYVLRNPFLRSFSSASLRAIFTRSFVGNYHPLTMLSLNLDYRLGGLEPWIYHLTNLILHLCNTILVYVFVFLLSKRFGVAAFTAALFGVHTLHVESVAWVAQRKDVLYAFFYFGALIAYLHFVRTDKRRYLAAALAAFALSLSSKAMAVTLPMVLLAVDVFEGRDIFSRKVLVEKLPFFLLSITFGVVAIVIQSPTAIARSVGHEFGLLERVAIASYAFVQYLAKLALPIGLSAIYPYPARSDFGLPVSFWLCPLVVAALLAVTTYFAGRARTASFGFFWFVVNIALVLQLLPVGDAIMADRYTYVSSVGIFVSLAALAGALLERWPRATPLLLCAGLAYLGLLSGLTFHRCAVWRDDMSLWSDILTKYPTEPTALNGRGVAKRARGELRGAIEDYTTIIETTPAFVPAWVNRGTARLILGDTRGAADDYSQALAIRPDLASPYAARCLAKHLQGDHAGAIVDCDAAVALEPASGAAYLTRGVARNSLGDHVGAIADFDVVIRLDSANSGAFFNRGLSRILAGDTDGGCADLRAAQVRGYEPAAPRLERYCPGQD